MARCNECHDTAALLVLQAERIGQLRDALRSVSRLSSEPSVADVAMNALADDRTKRMSDDGGRDAQTL